MERKHWLAGLPGQAFLPANLSGTQGIVLGIILCVLGARCVRALKRELNWLLQVSELQDSGQRKFCPWQRGG